MPRKFILIKLVCILLLHNANAQDSLPKVEMPLFIHGALFYDFPQSFGASAGIDFPVQIKTIFKIKNGDTSVRNAAFVTGAGLGFYRYEFNHTGLMLSSFIGTRHIYSNASYFEHLWGLGVLRTFYDGIVYSVDAGGTIKQKNNYGRTYATIHFALAYGWDFTRSKKPKPFAIQLQPVLWFQFPYNGFVLPHGSLAIAIKYHFKKLNVSIKHKEINKTHPA